MTNLHIHSVTQQAFTYQIHSIIFIVWIWLQRFEFLPFHFLMEILSHKTSKKDSSSFPTFPVSGNKNTIQWLRNLCLSWLSFSLTPHIHPATTFYSLASYKLSSPSLFTLLWSGYHLLLGGPHRLTQVSLSSTLTSLLSPPHHHQSQSFKIHISPAHPQAYPLQLSISFKPLALW